MIIVYLIRNDINKKIYIGQTSKNIATRFMQHTSSAKKQRNNCYKLENAINKYGKENFTIEEILRTENEEDANQLEISFTRKIFLRRLINQFIVELLQCKKVVGIPTNHQQPPAML
jgi:group I intron endonuclease